VFVLCEGFVAVSDNDNYESAQRAFSQVVLQLRHLVNVWRNILPSHVYAKALGMQINSLWAVPFDI